MLNKIGWGAIAKLGCITLLFLTVAGIANKQISFILLEGSIFKWLRDFIAVKWVAYEGKFFISWIFAKLHELFNCPLCMTGQIGLWLTLFLIIVTYKWWPSFVKLRPVTLRKIVLSVAAWFIMAMALAGAGYCWWGILEYKSRIAESQEQFYAEKLEILRLSLTDKNCKKVENQINLWVPLSQKEFLGIFSKIEKDCSNVCPCRLRRCRQNEMKKLIEKIAKEKRYSAILCQGLMGLLQKCSKEHPELFSKGERKKIIKQAYQQFAKDARNIVIQ